MAWIALLLALQDPPNSGAALRIEPLEKVYRPGEPMPMRFVVENATDKEAELDEPADYLEGLQIRDPEQRVVKTPGKLREVKRRHRVEGRGFFGRTLDVSRVLTVLEDREGAYHFRWQFQDRSSAEVRVFIVRDWIAAIETTLGRIEIEFHPDVAPNHVLHFLTLARRGFYTDARFYRVIPGFMMQGGNPKEAAKVTPIAAEFNERRHVAGTVSMAREKGPNSATSEFFICFGPAAHLDRAYTAFGTVVRGMEVVQKAEQEKTDHSPCAGCRQELPPRPTQHCGAHHEDRPVSDIVIKSVTLSVRKKP